MGQLLDDGESDSSGECSDDSDSSESSEHAHSAPSVQETSSRKLKRKKILSNSPVYSSLKKVRIAIDSDDEDDNILSYELPAVDKMVEVETGNTSVANSPPIVIDNLFVPFDVLASMANEVEKDVHVDSVDVDMSLASPVRVENVLEVANLNAQPEKNLADDRGDRTKVCRDIDRLQEEKKFSSECIRRLRAEKAEAFGDNQKLLARQKELEKFVLGHQEVSRERAISEDKLKARISDLEKEKKQLKFARQAEEEKTASYWQRSATTLQELQSYWQGSQETWSRACAV
ncbi:hypothetical protein OsJ_35518 [Oryza sativa Japonica Group]|uniref:Uncharacterized protein n=1 Tax=Oryza sativa subsp. japonica TaxID=39947 RepID=A3CFR1_ORYSJ|nr:hypothetical protein OsJ_35518 [Oryza sativa Japonica Group]